MVTSAIHRFGNSEFDEATGILTAAGEAVELDRSCRAILTALLRAQGGEVSKEALLQAGWPGRIVHENSLAKAISRLRKVLGPDSAALEARYGRGYRLTVPPPAVPAPAAEVPQPAPESSSRAAPRRRRQRVAALAAVAAVGATAAFALGLDRQYDAAPRKLIIGDPPGSIGKVLWVDDHPQNNVAEEELFEAHHIAVHDALTTADALTLLSMYRYDLVISDMGRGEDRLAGLKLVRDMRARGDRTPALIYTVRAEGPNGEQQQRDHAADAGAQGLVVTPQDLRSSVLRRFGQSPA